MLALAGGLQKASQRLAQTLDDLWIGPRLLHSLKIAEQRLISVEFSGLEVAVHFAQQILQLVETKRVRTAALLGARELQDQGQDFGLCGDDTVGSRVDSKGALIP